MLYALTQWLAEVWTQNFEVFKYLTLRGPLAVATAMLIALMMGPMMIRRLQILKFGQPIRNDGPESHMAKQGTPTMGGLLILFAIGGSTLLWGDLGNRYVWVLLITLLGFGAIGFADDWLKLKHKNPKGLAGKYKYLAQSILALGIGGYLYATASPIYGVPGGAPETTLIVPFFKEVQIQLGAFFILLTYFVIVGTSNAVNLTDGLDGLAIMPSVLVGGALGIFAYISGHPEWYKSFYLPRVEGAAETVVFCGALVGAGFGFLWYNTYPAQVFMGDVGSLALGAVLGVMAVIVRQEIVLFIMGGIFVVETLSVILQVGSFKLRGKRIFKMAPIHHHFELKGWPEPKVIVRFWIVTVLLVIIGLSSMKIR